MNPPAAAGGEEPGAAGGCRGAEGGGEAVGAAGVPEEPGLGEESLEEKLRSLTFRKQVSYRWVPVPVPCCPPRCPPCGVPEHGQGAAFITKVLPFLPLCLHPVPAVPSTPAPSSWERTCLGMWAGGVWPLCSYRRRSARGQQLLTARHRRLRCLMQKKFFGLT